MANVNGTTMTFPGTGAPCPGSSNYEYYIYGALGLLLAVSEAMGFTKSVKANGLVDLAVGQLGPALVKLRVMIMARRTPAAPAVSSAPPMPQVTVSVKASA